MPERQILVTLALHATDRADALHLLTPSTWIAAFPDGQTRPGKVVPLRRDYDRLTLLQSQLVGLVPYVDTPNARLHATHSVPFLATLLLTFAHPSLDALDHLLLLGTWFAPPKSLFFDAAWSAGTPPGSFASLLED